MRSTVFTIIVWLAASAAGQGQVTAGNSDIPTLEDLRAFQRIVQDVAARVSPATVGLRVGASQGSGVIVDPVGLIITAAHVFDRRDQLAIVILNDGRELKARCVGKDEELDVGLVRLDDKGPWPFAAMGRSSELDLGTPCIAVGHPGGFLKARQPVVRLGTVSGTDGRRRRFLRTNCAINLGDSGGPLFDLEGKVIGIHSRIRQGVTQNYHAPIDRVHENWRLLEGAPPPRVGIRGVTTRGNCRVTIVYPDLPAAKAGIKVDDIITKIDGDEVNSIDGLIRLVGRKSAGQVVKVGLRRDGEELILKLTLAAAAG